MAEAQKIDAAKVGVLRAEYDALCRKCTEAQVTLRKKGPEIAKRIEAELSRLGLSLTELVAKKRVAYIAWEQARDAQAQATAPKPAAIVETPEPQPEPQAGTKPEAAQA